MENAIPSRLKPRKTPLQARSGATVEAIHEAAIQVLLTGGLALFTTTRVAERAGVSVGTLYQYFPNKQALLFAILLRHFAQIAEAIEAIPGHGKPIAAIAEDIADAYVSVKLARPDATTALYRVAGAIDQFRMSADVLKRLEAAVVRLLTNAADASYRQAEKTAITLLSSLAGLSRGSFGKLAVADDALDGLGAEARLLSAAYLRAAADA